MDNFHPDFPVRIDLSAATEIIRLIADTFVKATGAGYEWDVDAFIAAMEYVSLTVAVGEDKGKVFLLCRRDRHIRRTRADGRLEDAPDSGGMRQEYEKINTTTATMMLFRQQGDKDSGWRDCPFWWPVLYMPTEMKTTVFAGKVDDYNEDELTLV